MNLAIFAYLTTSEYWGVQNSPNLLLFLLEYVLNILDKKRVA